MSGLQHKREASEPIPMVVQRKVSSVRHGEREVWAWKEGNMETKMESMRDGRVQGTFKHEDLIG